MTGDPAVWRIGDPAGRPGGFGPSPFYGEQPAEAVFRVGVDDDAHWPAVQPGPLDRDGRYRSHTASVLFDLPAGAFDLSGGPSSYGFDLEMYVESPSGPVPHLAVDLNGHAGEVWLDPRRDPDPRLHFRSVVGGWMLLRIPIPARCFTAGANRLSLRTVCLDEVDPAELLGPFGGTASGFGSVLRWGGIALLPRTSAPPGPALELHPTALFRRTSEGGLDEVVDVVVTGSLDAGRLELRLPDHKARADLPALAFGRRRVRLSVPEQPGPVDAEVTLAAGDAAVRLATTMRPARKWTLHLIPHVHLDVGYTDYQGKVIELHSRNLDRVLALRERNPDYAFWVDGSFVVARYLESRSPDAVARLTGAIRSGHVGVNALWFLFLTGVASLEECYRAGAYAERLRRDLGVAVDTANLTDVPSYSSAVPSALRAIGVEQFLGIANHTRATGPSTEDLHARSPFRWVGPDGGEVTTFLARHYSQLRYLAAHPPTVAGCADGFARLCEQYERDDYLPDDLPIVGINNDNEDHGHGEIDLVERWHRAYAWPRLRYSTADDYFAALADCRDRLPEVRGDGGSYWEDGVGAHAATVAAYRSAQTLLPAAEGLAALLSLHDPGLRPALEPLDRGWEQLLIGCEHTWTSAHSVVHPHSHQTVDQLDWKVGQVHGAHRVAVDESRRALSQLGELATTDGHAYVVYNPLPWTRSGDVEVDGDVRNPGRAHVTDVPGLGYRVLPRGDLTGSGASGAPAEPVGDGAHRLGRYEVRLTGGRIVGLRHLGGSRELIDPAAAWSLADVLYVSGGGTERGLGMGAEATRLYDVGWHLPEPDLHVHRAEPTGDVVLDVHDGSWSVTTSWTAPSMRGRTTVGGRDDSDRVDVEVWLDKEAVRAKESVYVAFPFSASRPRLRYDRQQGWVDPTTDHQPGACQEWLTVQHAVLLDGDEGGLAWSSAHAPLFCTGDIVRGRWADRAEVRDGTLLSWVMNNYWFTNYPGSQAGEVRLRYAFAPVGRDDLAAAGRLGRELRQPLLAQEVHGLDKAVPGGALPQTGRLLSLEADPNVTGYVVAARWSDGVVVRLQEIAGGSGRAVLTLPPGVRAARPVDARERTVGDELAADAAGSVTVEVPRYAVVHLLLDRTAADTHTTGSSARLHRPSASAECGHSAP